MLCAAMASIVSAACVTEGLWPRLETLARRTDQGRVLSWVTTLPFFSFLLPFLSERVVPHGLPSPFHYIISARLVASSPTEARQGSPERGTDSTDTQQL